MTSWTLPLKGLSFYFSFFFPLTFSWASPTPPTYLWSDSKGFISASSCQTKNELHVPFYVSQAPNSALDSSVKMKTAGFLNRLLSNSLLDRSLIALQNTSKPSPTSWVRVLSVPKNAPRGGLNVAKSGESGQVPTEALQEIGNFILEILEPPKSLKPLGTEKLPFRVSKTFWQAKMDNEYYVTLSCKEGTLEHQYLIFEVYDLTQIQPVAQVGLRIDQVEILQKIHVFTPDEANQLVSPGGELSPEASEEGPAEEPPLGTPPRPRPGASPSDPADRDVEDPEGEEPPPSGPGAGSGSANPLEYILCTADDLVAVKDPGLKTVLFKADPFETITPIQSWNEKQKSTHIEVQFPNRSGVQKSGWVPREVVQLRSHCKELRNDSSSPDNDNNDIDMTGVQLSTKDCCKFPTIKRSTQAYTQGILRFRARRSRGRRLHAACDLYRRHGESAVAVASGIIIRGLYYFYQGVFALEIKHPRFVARYGEILGKSLPGIRKGQIVKAGQQIGRIGTVSSRCCPPMLHFELYSGARTGPLTRYRLPPFDRRQDLINPTNYLRQWEKAQFGRSY